MSVSSRAAAATAINADGDAEDAYVASGTDDTVELYVKRTRSLGPDGDLVAHAGRDHELGRFRKNLEILGSIRS